MAKYRVSVVERKHGSVTVEASSFKEAYNLAENAYADGNIEWDKTDLKVQGIEEK